MSWIVTYLDEAVKDLTKLSKERQKLALKAINKVKENPLPNNEGGYGKPLGNVSGNNLTGLYKIKLRGEGLRIVYKLVRVQNHMIIIIIGFRDDNEVYELASQRKKKHNL